MPLDPALLDEARARAARLDETERQATLATADFHSSVRRLHLAGGSLREIGEALSLSHQRVQQIVAAAGGSWWRRAWKSRRAQRDAICTWCERPPAEVAKLIAGPNVFICDRCVAEAKRAAGGRAGVRFGEVSTSLAVRCSFCGRRARDGRALLRSPTGSVCTDCLDVCRAILDGRASKPGRP